MYGYVYTCKLNHIALYFGYFYRPAIDNKTSAGFGETEEPTLTNFEFVRWHRLPALEAYATFVYQAKHYWQIEPL